MFLKILFTEFDFIEFLFCIDVLPFLKEFKFSCVGSALRLLPLAALFIKLLLGKFNPFFLLIPDGFNCLFVLFVPTLLIGCDCSILFFVLNIPIYIFLFIYSYLYIPIYYIS